MARPTTSDAPAEPHEAARRLGDAAVHAGHQLLARVATLRERDGRARPNRSRPARCARRSPVAHRGRCPPRSGPLSSTVEGRAAAGLERDRRPWCEAGTAQARLEGCSPKPALDLEREAVVARRDRRGRTRRCGRWARARTTTRSVAHGHRRDVLAELALEIRLRVGPGNQNDVDRRRHAVIAPQSVRRR